MTAQVKSLPLPIPLDKVQLHLGAMQLRELTLLAEVEQLRAQLTQRPPLPIFETAQTKIEEQRFEIGRLRAELAQRPSPAVWEAARLKVESQRNAIEGLNQMLHYVTVELDSMTPKDIDCGVSD